METNKKELQKLKDKTFILNFTIPQVDIKKEYQKSLESVRAQMKIKGFRPGKAPLDVVEKEISQSAIIEDIASHLISHVYSDKIKQYDLKPVIQPQVKVINLPLTLEKDWQIEIQASEIPDIQLDPKFKEAIKKLNAAKNDKDNQKKEGDDNVENILQTLVKFSKIDFPAILLESDLKTRLSELVNQTSQAGITVEQYLKQQGQTLAQYQQQLQDQIKRDWAINLSIDQIFSDQKMEITQKEIEDFISKNPQFNSNPRFVYFILRQQKVIDYLKSL